MTILRVDNSLLDKRVKSLEEHSHQENEIDPPSQNPSDEEDETVNPIADMARLILGSLEELSSLESSEDDG
ncbi:hypothetical protein SO802_003406 [Lithocarpus litseifolius]|uniref:Uncharacterized protein n=1 Tax=Lithocarpus litseifolius TaxID=425828 RepID=A0AAW2E2N5_9ROSI